MKSTGIVRKVDNLGRIVLEKYQPSCIFCGNTEEIVYFNGKRLCSACIERLKDNF